MPRVDRLEIASGANCAGTKMIEAFGAVSSTASATVLNTGTPCHVFAALARASYRRRPSCRTRHLRWCGKAFAPGDALDEQAGVFIDKNAHAAKCSFAAPIVADAALTTRAPPPRPSLSTRGRTRPRRGSPGLLPAFVPDSRTTIGTFTATLRQCLANAVRDDIATGDAAEDVDEHRLDFRVARISRNAVATCSALAPPPTSRKLAGSPPLQLDRVHRRHRQAGAVDHAADVAVELDEGDAGALRFDLGSFSSAISRSDSCGCGGRGRCRRRTSWSRAPANRLRR